MTLGNYSCNRNGSNASISDHDGIIVERFLPLRKCLAFIRDRIERKIRREIILKADVFEEKDEYKILSKIIVQSLRTIGSIIRSVSL